MEIKKVILGLTVLPLFVGGVTQAHSGHGYVGLGLGASYKNMTNNGITSIGNEGEVRDSSRLSSTGLVGQLEVGYLKNFSSFFMIGEAFFRAPESATTSRNIGILFTNDTSLKRDYTGGCIGKVWKEF